jgi:hypothetical protein
MLFLFVFLVFSTTVFSENEPIPVEELSEKEFRRALWDLLTKNTNDISAIKTNIGGIQADISQIQTEISVMNGRTAFPRLARARIFISTRGLRNNIRHYACGVLIRFESELFVLTGRDVFTGRRGWADAGCYDWRKVDSLKTARDVPVTIGGPIWFGKEGFEDIAVIPVVGDESVFNVSMEMRKEEIELGEPIYGMAEISSSRDGMSCMVTCENSTHVVTTCGGMGGSSGSGYADRDGKIILFDGGGALGEEEEEEANDDDEEDEGIMGEQAELLKQGLLHFGKAIGSDGSERQMNESIPEIVKGVIELVETGLWNGSATMMRVSVWMRVLEGRKKNLDLLDLANTMFVGYSKDRIAVFRYEESKKIMKKEMRKDGCVECEEGKTV